ncbi:glycosyltransferase family 4 protein [Wenzhouxiangella sp. XN201]|uniref:glycosyltransferase family 4 protein n=1 Tax=Wenzhouxiangella sp. XN201 TaxID=2710755 RepID=UPI0013CA33B2|nr:glycosyltransferase family 4 protein [Wenzhouxiangella sp. XN201]NEZ04112.1 glycosyltransferase family 4 protein [Wenzhouxiangella sp. XN201]
MHILQVNNYDHVRGGSDVVFFETSQLLKHAGHRVTPFATIARGQQRNPENCYFPTTLDTRKAGVLSTPRFLHNRAARRGLSAMLSDLAAVDVAHLHIYYGQLTSSILGELRRRRIPIVQTLHEYKLACPIYTMVRGGHPCDLCVNGSTWNLVKHRCKDDSLSRSMLMLAEFWASRLQGDVRHIDRFICISEFQRKVMLRAGLPEEKLMVINNFVDVDAFRPCASNEKGDYLLYFGRIEALKGVPTLVEAAHQSGRRLILAGTGSWQGELAAFAGRSKYIEHLGFLEGEKLHDLVSKARAVVVPSEWYEPFGLTVLEAKASGTPVIGSDMGAIPGLIRDGIDGFVFTAGSIESLTAAIERLERSDLSVLAQAARSDVLDRFSSSSHLAKLMGVYGQAIERNDRES